jgi:hypothetical protein
MGPLNNLSFNGLNNSQQQLVNNTLQQLDQNEYASNFFDFINEQNTPIQLGGDGLSADQAAGTFFNDDGSVNNIILGEGSFESSERFAGDLFNELYSGVSIPGSVNEGKGQVGDFITQQQEYGSFFGDGFAQELAQGNNDPKAKEAIANLDAFYGMPTGDVIKHPDGYGSLEQGSEASSGLQYLADNGFLPKEFAEEAQNIINEDLGVQSNSAESKPGEATSQYRQEADAARNQKQPANTDTTRQDRDADDARRREGLPVSGDTANQSQYRQEADQIRQNESDDASADRRRQELASGNKTQTTNNQNPTADANKTDTAKKPGAINFQDKSQWGPALDALKDKTKKVATDVKDKTGQDPKTLSTTKQAAKPSPTASKAGTPSPTASKAGTPSPTASKAGTPSPTASKAGTPSPTASKAGTPSPTASKAASPSPTAKK